MSKQICESKISTILIISIPIIILGGGFLPYFFNFSDQGLSNDQEVWAHFGDYMNLWMGLASLFSIVSLTYLIHRREQHQQQAAEEKEDALNRPYLVFLWTNRTYYFQIKNIGNGPALDIRTSFKPRDETNYVLPYEQTPLGRGDITDFKEYHDGFSEFVAVYSDIWGNKISTFYSSSYINEIKIGHDEFYFLSDKSKDYSCSDRPSDPSHL